MDHEKIDGLRKGLQDVSSKLPHRASHIYASEDCSGDGIYNCKNTNYAFDCKDCEDCKYIYNSPKCLKVHDCVYCAPDGVRFSYNVVSIVGLERSMSLFNVWYGSDIYYSMECRHSYNIFGCAGLKNKEYCVLNKQYSRKEYEELVPRIIEHMRKTGEWGEHLAYELSPFAYNETVAQEYFPIVKEEAVLEGLLWKDREEIVKVGGEDVYACAVTGRSFKVLPKEKEFYKRMKVPVPCKHPDQRHLDRLELRRGIKLFGKNCDRCGNKIQTNLSDVSFEIYCDECYKSSI